MYGCPCGAFGTNCDCTSVTSAEKADAECKCNYPHNGCPRCALDTEDENEIVESARAVPKCTCDYTNHPHSLFLIYTGFELAVKYGNLQTIETLDALCKSQTELFLPNVLPMPYVQRSGLDVAGVF